MAKNNFKYDDIFSDEDKENIRKDYVDNEYSIRDLKIKYNIKSSNYIERLLKPFLRNNSEAGKLAHKNKPECFKHSDETKHKMREKRLAYMKEHPENTAWRKRNKPSYPEQCFIKFLKENEYDKKYLIEREKSLYPYYIDFAFVDIKLAVEIDGSQHILDEDRKLNDDLKNQLLLNDGWKVLRISENIVKNDWETLNNKINNAITKTDIIFEQVGIIKAPKTREKVKRDEFGYSDKQIESAFKQRKVKRPSKEELLNEINEHSFASLGRKYGVSDNAIRKWCKYYKIPYRKKDLNKNFISH
jgi:very-short-patch-repair endonuclease